MFINYHAWTHKESLLKFVFDHVHYMYHILKGSLTVFLIS